MIAEIASAYEGLKSATDIVKGLDAISKQVAINEVKIQLQTHILDAREALTKVEAAQSSALQEIRELKAEIVKLKDWEADKQRYELKAIDRGSVAYLLKPGMENGEPPHWLCPNCFNRGQKSFLQFKGQDRTPTGGLGNQSTYACDACRVSMKVNYSRNPLTPWSPS